MQHFEIPYYHDYISPSLFKSLMQSGKKHEKIADLIEIGESGGLETPDSFLFLCELYDSVKDELKKILAQRMADRKFIDERTKSCYKYNCDLKIDFLSKDYKTVIGHEDTNSRIVVGPKTKDFTKINSHKPVAPIPEFLQGNHVTLFGPPDNAKLSINAMNAYHRKLKNEPAIIEQLLSSHTSLPKWGADDEDSKTPLRADLISAGENLTACFDRTLRVANENVSSTNNFINNQQNKIYELEKEKLSLPIKRFPGLALPCTFLFYKANPIPLHLYDFALHFFKNWHNKESLVFYVPKLENEEEARYIRIMLEKSEKLIKKLHPEYIIGSIRLMIVLENPRAILRTHEIMDELYPYFMGASLGWHDYLASTARLFKEDANYRIPVKADPNIVIKYIKCSHQLLASVVGERGGIKVGGMYGILPTTTDLLSDSFQVTIKGFIKDVITQMKRDLTGFWVAHPDFIRIGLALVEAWNFYCSGDKSKLENIITNLLDKKYHTEILQFVFGPDVEGLNVNDDMYVRSLLVADLKESEFIANNHPNEIRYNVFQSLQYLTDWLSGNGCVALPAQIDGVSVRVMDDLATAERSRWEVWHEIYHRRFCLSEFLKIVHEEMQFIRKDLSSETKIVQVKWNERTEKWYPIAMKLMIKLMTDLTPVEFATELLLPFTIPTIRESVDPWKSIQEIDNNKFDLQDEIKRFNNYFEFCGCVDFAKEQAQNLVLDLNSIEKHIKKFTKEQIIEAAYFHGDIGENKKTLDSRAAYEQSLVSNEAVKIKTELKSFGKLYLEKFGFKFLISAKEKSGLEILNVLKKRIENSLEIELENAKYALWEITYKRILDCSQTSLKNNLESLRQKYNVVGATIAVTKPSSWLLKSKSSKTFGQANPHVQTNIKTYKNPEYIQTICLGDRQKEQQKVTPTTWFQYASLSKTIATAFALEYFKKNNIPLETPVNELLSQTKSPFRLKAEEYIQSNLAEQVLLKHLIDHTALNLHYVNGYPANGSMPPLEELLVDVKVIGIPGENFNYSGGGFLVLEHLIEAHSGKNIQELTENILNDFSFNPKTIPQVEYAYGYNTNADEIPGTRFMFPSFAAGATGTAKSVLSFLNNLMEAYHDPTCIFINSNQNVNKNENFISHDTAVKMLHGYDKGSKKFMGCKMGLGVFIAEAGDNKFAVHQGANDGFRAIFIHCFTGPDCGKGFVIQCNGELNGVLFISEVAQLLLKELKIKGIDFNKFTNQVGFDKTSEEQIVNKGYKHFIFDAFTEELPEKIVAQRETDPLSPFNLAVDGKIEEVSDQKFARTENLLSPFLPIFDPNLYGKQGKIMDSWESVRHNEKEYDHMIFTLNSPSEINYVSFSTKFHAGNHAPVVKIEALEEQAIDWLELVPLTPLEGHAYKCVKLTPSKKVFSKIKVLMYPDGGLTRLGLYKELDESKYLQSYIYSDPIPTPLKPLSVPYTALEKEIEVNLSRFKQGDEINVASAALGAKLVHATNEHYGPACQVISPYDPINMFDGFESARSREQDHSEECVIKLIKTCKIHRIEFNFTYFINNNPKFISVEGKNTHGEWLAIIPKTKVKAFAGNFKSFQIEQENKFSEIKVMTYPDGGINRIKVLSHKCE